MKKFLRRLAAALCVSCLLVTSASALTVEEAIELLEENYVGELPDAVYDAQTLDELFAALGDPYTYYMDAEDYRAFSSSVESEQTVTGIGVSIEYTTDGIRVLTVLEGGGAQEAGIVPGDLIVAIDGVSCVPAGEADRSRIVGEEGTSVTLTVRRADGSEEELSIVRRAVTIHNTTVSAQDGVVTLDCDSFGSQTGTYFTEGVERYADEAELWVVDLRSNAGGLAASAATGVASFIGPGAHLYYRDRSGNYFAQFAFNERLTEGKPVVVLVNEYSASASEIFAGDARAYGLGIVLGSRTYGKGTAQIICDAATQPDLFDGDALKLTAYRFFCPDGNTSDRIGVIPTLLVEDEAAPGVLSLLAVSEPAGDRLRLPLAGWTFYVNLETALPEHAADLGALLDALPPEIAVTSVLGGEEQTLDARGTAQRLGLSLSDRRFTDVAASPFCTQIDTLGVYGILRGAGDGTFSPGGTLTRAELCAMLAQALNAAAPAPAFSDVAADAWYAPSVGAMAQLGLVVGDGSGRFLPEGTLTQQEFFTVLGRLAAFLNTSAYARYTQADAQELAADEQLSRLADWARAGTDTLDRLFVDESGAPVTMLWDELAAIDPAAPILREQAAATLFNLLTMLRLIVY